MHVPEDDHAPFREKWPQFNSKIGKYKGPVVANPIAAFAGMMTRMDRHVGQLLDLLKELGIDDNTIVSFTSDNGPHMEGGHDPKFFDSNGNVAWSQTGPLRRWHSSAFPRPLAGQNQARICM